MTSWKRGHPSSVGLALSVVYLAVAIRLLVRGATAPPTETFAGIYWYIAAFPWSLAVNWIGSGDLMVRGIIIAGVFVNVVLSYLWGTAWQRWWKEIRKRQ